MACQGLSGPFLARSSHWATEVLYLNSLCSRKRDLQDHTPVLGREGAVWLAGLPTGVVTGRESLSDGVATQIAGENDDFSL